MRLVMTVVLLLSAVVAACDRSPDGQRVPASRLIIVFEDNQDRVLGRYEATTRATLAETFAKVTKVLSVGAVTVTVRADAARTIEGIGVGGFAPGPGVVLLSVDPSRAGHASFPVFLAYTLSHELHHAARWRRPGFGLTLFETMITEGLADRFSDEVLGDEYVAPPWINAFPQEKTQAMLDLARPELDDTQYDRGVWFFGKGSLPRWTGYTLGYRLVAAYQAAHPGTTAAELVATPADAFAAKLLAR